MRLTLPDRFFDYLPWALATLLIAGIVHIVSVLLMPAVAPHTAYARILRAVGDAPAEGLVPLPAAAPGAEPLPFEDPSFAEGVCVYDLSKGLLRVTTPADGEDFLAVSFLSSGGRLYHAITDRAAIKGRIDIVIGDEKQMDALQGAGEEAAPQEVRLTSPTKRGFVLVRALAKRTTDLPRARERLGAVACSRFDAPKG